MNSIGHNFRITLYGESHGQFIGIIIDGCPPGIAIDEVEIAEELLRRRSRHKATTPRIEEDAFNILSGVYNGKSTGAPINIQIENTKANSKEYKDFTAKPRPGHADFTARTKYMGFNDPRGGGMFPAD